MIFFQKENLQKEGKKNWPQRRRETVIEEREEESRGEGEDGKVIDWIGAEKRGKETWFETSTKYFRS